MSAEQRPTAARKSRYVGKSKTERAQLRREDLIEAGIELIGTAGVDQLRVRNVCEHACLTQRYFYESFSGLDNFTHEVVRAAAIRTARPVLTATEGDRDPRNRARTGLRALINVFAADPRLARILFIETMRAGGRHADLRNQMLAGGAGVIRLWLDATDAIDGTAIIQAGLEELADPERASGMTENLDPGVFVLSGATSELIVAWIEGRTNVEPEDLVDQLIRLYDFVAAHRA